LPHQEAVTHIAAWWFPAGTLLSMTGKLAEAKQVLEVPP
jgi:hypothetical protein